MAKILIGFFLIIFCLSFLATQIFAGSSQSYVTIVNPIRGEEFWESSENIEDTVLGQLQLASEFNVAMSWLLRFDSLNNSKILDLLKNTSSDTHERGLLLEITPSLAKAALVTYRQSESWHLAESVFLTGYEPIEREKLIDTAFEKFKQVYGEYPKSVGAWWIDAHSLSYMQDKYKIAAAIIVADQYSTDNYQVWGQYFGTPYYPAKNNVLFPAKNVESKIPIVITQWAARDPINGYGRGVEESTYSVQANDYIDYHNLSTKYFESLVDVYTNQNFNALNHLVVGLENSYSWQKYQDEYRKQVQTLVEKTKKNQLSIVNLSDFSTLYQKKFPTISPSHIIVSKDPLGSNKEVVWFMNPYYRVGWFVNSSGSVFRDIRQYVDGDEEICLKNSCKELNLATSATRVLDEVTFSNHWIIDEGEIKNVSVVKKDESYVISYDTQTGRKRIIELLPRDIKIDDRTYSIDSAILKASTLKLGEMNKEGLDSNFNSKINLFAFSIFASFGKFVVFMIFLVLIPGFMFYRLITKEKGRWQLVFLSLVSGIVILTYFSILLGYLKMMWLLYVYAILCGIFLIIRRPRISRYNYFDESSRLRRGIFSALANRSNFIFFSLIILGTIFQVIPVYKSGIDLVDGLGFWGPNGHDGVWHLALINQLVNNLPPQNPIFSGEILTNYHYFYDLLIATTHTLTKIPVTDLVFRMYPIVFSLGLGLGTVGLIKLLTGSKLAIGFALYLVYFAGSFGWIVEYLRERHIGGESAFWANQAVSFNLNPPFAISLLLVIGFFLLLYQLDQSKRLILGLIMVCGVMLGFKAYSAILIFMTLAILGLVRSLKKDFEYLLILLGGGLISLILLIPSYGSVSTLFQSSSVFVFSPFWFVHSMVDSTDRVGWARLSLARTTSWVNQQWPKFIISEVIGLLIFVIGNLGIRFLGLFGLIRGSFGKEQALSSGNRNLNKILLVFSITSLLLPLLFIQSGNPWNTIQFLYYFMYMTSLFAAIVVARIYQVAPKALGVLVVIGVIILTPINSIVTAYGYLYPTPHTYISSQELRALRFLANQESGVVLTYPYDKTRKKDFSGPLPLLVYETSSYVSALSKKPTFVEDEIQQDILNTNFKERLIVAKEYFRDPKEGEKFLKQNNIRYIYLPKLYQTILLEGSVTKVFENKEVLIYKYY